MPFNTKKWDVRLDETIETIRTTPTRYAPTVADNVAGALALLGSDAERRFLSNSLHIDKRNTQGWRKYVRAIALTEEMIVAEINRRNFQAILGAYGGHTENQMYEELRSLILSLEPNDVGAADLTKRRPLVIGTSVSGGKHPGPGSIACFVRDGVTGKTMLLSNQHVIRAGGEADTTDVLQPARNNGGGDGDRVAVYQRGVLDARMDAAVCQIDDAVAWQNQTRKTTANFPPVLITGISDDFAVGQMVWKCGAMSGVTRGRIRSIAAEKSVPHNQRVGGPVTFTNQIEVESANGGEFQIPGDSGAALLNENNQVIGLLHAGANGGALATPIRVVFDALGVGWPG